jgi:SNF2 family DNA or RNA helicase
MTIPPPYKHQEAITDFCEKHPSVADFSDPGIGKTRGHLDFIKNKGEKGRTLVLCPLTIMETAWLDDCRKFTPELSMNLAFAHNRAQAFAANSNIVVTNWDATVWIEKHFRANPHFLDEFDTLIIDESTGFKNIKAGRTKSLANIRHLFEHRQLMTGTPNPQGVLDLWSQAFILDDGAALGKNYFGFRNQVTTPVQVGRDPHAVRWTEKPGALETAVAALAPITIRFAAKDCVDIPQNHRIQIATRLSPSAMKQYQAFAKDMILELDRGTVSAAHAGARAIKLMQLCTGAVYDGDRLIHLVHTERYELVIDLVQQRPWASLVLFNWGHEKQQLVELAAKRKMRYAVLDGETPATERGAIVRRFQAGDLDVIFAHPRTVAYGLTLTTGRTTIWSSPTPNAEWYMQANKRVDRNGQQYETETIDIYAEGTREWDIYELLTGKTDRIDDFLNLLIQMQEAA